MVNGAKDALDNKSLKAVANALDIEQGSL